MKATDLDATPIQHSTVTVTPLGETISEAEGALLRRIKHFHTHDFGRGPELHPDAVRDAFKLGKELGRASVVKPEFSSDGKMIVEQIVETVINEGASLKNWVDACRHPSGPKFDCDRSVFGSCPECDRR